MSEKIKISFLAANCYSLFYEDSNQGFGGAEVDMYNLALYFSQKEDFEVEFFVGDYGFTAPREMIHGICVRKIRLFGWTAKTLSQKLIFYTALATVLRHSKSEVLLTEMANSMVGWAALFFKGWRKKLLIHRLASDKDTDCEFLSKNDKRSNYTLYRFGLKKADHIFSQTRHQQKLLMQNMGLDSQVVPNGFFIRKNLSMKEKNYFLWVGRKSAVKRPDLFLRLVQDCPNENFVMIMPSQGQEESGEFNQQVDALLNQVSQLSNFHFYEYVPFSKIQRYFDQAKALVNTSDFEGFPNIFIQACMGATPLLSLHVNPDNFITRFQLGLYADGQMETIKNFIQGDHQAQITFYAKNALKYAEEYHDISIMGQSYEKAIREWVTQKKKRKKIR